MTNVLANPVFTPQMTNALLTVDSSRAADGLVGVELLLPADVSFTRGRSQVGTFAFDFVSGANALAGGLFFTNTPTALEANDTNSQALVLSASVLPSVEPGTPPALNRQSGLLEQVVTIGHPGLGSVTNAQVLASGLGADSSSNSVTLFNAHGTMLVDLDADGARESVPFVQLLSLAPGESRPLTLEYYVTDHMTVPSPDYSSLTSDGFVPGEPVGDVLAITRAVFTNNSFLIEFLTRDGVLYHVQYAGTPAELNDNAAVKTASPPVSGTGSRVQWVDNGPPKTESPPAGGNRFYRVRETQPSP